MIKFSKIKHNILELIPKVVEYLSGQNETVAVYLFGSYAEGKEGPLSDFDIAILFERSLSRNNIWELQDEVFANLSRILRTDEISLVPLNAAPLRIKFEIILKGKLLFSRDDRERVSFESYTLRRYWDFKRYSQEYDRCLIQRLKEELDETQLREYQSSLGKIRSVHQRVKETSENKIGGFRS